MKLRRAIYLAVAAAVFVASVALMVVGYRFGAEYVSPTGQIGRIPPLVWAASGLFGLIGVAQALLLVHAARSS